jgi:hypothetical protein
MKKSIAPSIRGRASAEAGYSIIELLIAMGITTAIMGATLGGLGDVMRSNDMVVRITTMNNGLRAGMDLMTRDLLQAGAGLPKGHVISTPSGAGVLIKRPGPPGTACTIGTACTNVAAPNISAVIPGYGLGPVINGTATDIITILTADNNFVEVGLTAMTSTSVTVVASVNIGTGMDRVIPGQLMMVLKGSNTTLVQVTAVSAGTRQITFATSDSLNLNQTAAGVVGNLATLNTQAPALAAGAAAAAAATRITRVRMISYYLDNTTSPGRPRLVRRINNGHESTPGLGAPAFDNTLGTAVALDMENLRFTYDLTDGATNPGAVRFIAADLTTGGACAPGACFPTQIRKVNVMLSARSDNATTAPHTPSRAYRNTLNSQVALRGMALVNEYQQ